MGFFSKLKANLKHGGVKVRMDAPASISMNSGIVPVKVTVTASDTVAVIKNVTLELILDPDTSKPETDQMQKTIASSEDTGGFTLQPGEAKTVELGIAMNAGKALQETLPEGSAVRGIASALGKLQSVSDAMNNDNHHYSLYATADVDGIAIDPADRVSVQVTRPGEIGLGKNIRL